MINIKIKINITMIMIYIKFNITMIMINIKFNITMIMIIRPGEESCGNSTEIFTTETPSSRCNEVIDDDSDGGGDDIGGDDIGGDVIGGDGDYIDGGGSRPNCSIEIEEIKLGTKIFLISYNRLGTTSASAQQGVIWSRRKRR